MGAYRLCSAQRNSQESAVTKCMHATMQGWHIHCVASFPQFCHLAGNVERHIATSHMKYKIRSAYFSISETKI